ncbi:hypothetical protein [Paraburkholderia sp. RL17-337-BIB-A]|jgi:hypothetical protein|uniref:hypothetical protein n=1 Tax=Paraburkholderia sp. RL17-337-BIB-A TaxID=3031636 RepID=UPI0038BC8F5A
MDMREIQRLHAQFAPDSMVIDLPRQIAALPAPGDFSADSAPTARARWMKAGPRARLAVISFAVAAVVGMAGMGAASVYTNWRAAHQTAPIAAPPQKSLKPETPAVEETTPRFKEIDAAPALSASEFDSAASLGLTADQFRNSMKTPTRPGTAAVSPTLTTEAERAATSPIHRASANREQLTAAPQPTPAPTPVASAANSTAVNVPTQTTPATAPAAVPAPATPDAETGKAAHPIRRHISRPRAEQPSESDIPSKPAAATRAGAPEVQMF